MPGSMSSSRCSTVWQSERAIISKTETPEGVVFEMVVGPDPLLFPALTVAIARDDKPAEVIIAIGGEIETAVTTTCSLKELDAFLCQLRGELAREGSDLP